MDESTVIALYFLSSEFLLMVVTPDLLDRQPMTRFIAQCLPHPARFAITAGHQQHSTAPPEPRIMLRRRQVLLQQNCDAAATLWAVTKLAA